MAPVLLSRYLDPFLGVFTGFFAYYLYETHPRTTVPPDQRLAVLVKWKITKYQQQRAERLRAMDEVALSQGSK
ncbi:hypothetical protein L208DRAFT_1387276 [Tricholoma matsutake]|nr:hypothetical protein L208DRAFT_1387276 [Tricholoma matsutake 945]